jgi:hypothetical protein
MTPLMREKKKIDSLPPPPRYRVDGPHRKGEGLLCHAQRAWALGPRGNGVAIPVWYSGQYGIPSRLLRKPSRDSTPQEKALGLIVRMNHMLDYPYLYGMDPRLSFFCLPARRLRVVCRSVGPMFIGDRGSGFTAAYAMNTSYASSNNYDWKRALASTLRNFVHFVGLLKDQRLHLMEFSSL